MLGYAPERVDVAGRRSLAGADRRRGRTTPTRCSAPRWSPRRCLVHRTRAAGPLPGYGYVGGLERNLLLPTALGALRPSALVPETMAAGDAAGLGRVAIVGTPALRDFHPACAPPTCGGRHRRARRSTSISTLERADMNALGIARHWTIREWRAEFCAQLSPLLGAEEHVGLPAMLGLRDPHGGAVDLEQRLGRRVFEIPTLPPSVPGMRLYEILRAALRAAGGPATCSAPR